MPTGDEEFHSQVNLTYARPSRARRTYSCSNCSSVIRVNAFYFRIEPHPMARYHRGEKTKHICIQCAGGKEQAAEMKFGLNPIPGYNRAFRETMLSGYEQLSLLLDEPLKVERARVYVIDVSRQLIERIRDNHEELFQISPEEFEILICDLFTQSGFQVQRVGNNIYQKDGGIDIVAFNDAAPFRFFLAAQVKHHRTPKTKTGPEPIQRLYGTIQDLGFNAGAVITNTAFTPDAEFFAKKHAMLLRLKNVKDIKRWLLGGNILDEYDLRDIPEQIEVCPGVYINLPKPSEIKKYNNGK